MRARLKFIKISFWVYFVLLIVSSPRSSNAAEWAARPSILVGGEYNDNLSLTTQPHDSVYGSTITPTLDLRVSSEIWQIRGDMAASRRRFPGNRNFDSDNQFYNLAANYRMERSTWQLAGSRSETTTFSEQQITPDTGVVEVQRKYDSYRVNPSWTWAMDQLTQLQLAYSLSAISYVDGQSVGLYDYTARGVTAQLSKSLDPRYQVFVSTTYSVFNIPSTTLKTNSTIYQAGINWSFSQTLNGTFSAGLRRASNEQQAVVCTVSFGSVCLQTATNTQSTKQSSSVYNASLEKKYEVTRARLTFSRTYDPTGLGGIVRTDSQNLALDRRFSSRLTGTFTADNYNYTPETGDLTNVKRHYYGFAPGLKWAWTNELNVNLTYRYSHIKRVENEQPATSNSFYLTFNYQWPKMAISR